MHSTGLFIGTSGAVRPSIFGPSSRPTGTSPTPDNNAYVSPSHTTRNIDSGQCLTTHGSMLTPPSRPQALLKETEKLLETWKHPDPYLPPMAPGGTLSADTINATSVYYQSDILMRHNTGSKFERNLPTPRVDRELPPLLNQSSTRPSNNIAQLLHHSSFKRG